MTQITIENARENLLKQSEARIDYENAKERAATQDESAVALISKKLAKQRDALNHDAVLQAAIDFDCADFTFFNTHKRSNERFNIYCIEKIAKILRNTVKADSMSKHCYNVLFNAYKLRENKTFEYTRSLVKSTVSAHYRDNKSRNISKLAKRCDTVSASTASTQASSTINALRVLNIAKVIKSEDAVQDKLVFDFENSVFDLVK